MSGDNNVMTFSLNFSKGIALVVGGSGGIGSVIASRLALAGTQVAITYYKNKSAAEDLCVAFNKGLLPNSFDDDFYFNVNRLKRINAK